MYPDTTVCYRTTFTVVQLMSNYSITFHEVLRDKWTQKKS